MSRFYPRTGGQREGCQVPAPPGAFPETPGCLDSSHATPTAAAG